MPRVHEMFHVKHLGKFYHFLTISFLFLRYNKIMNVLGSALSALLGQSQKVATSANNIANAGTTGFKAGETSFATASPQAGGGVRAVQRNLINQQGPLIQSSNSLDMGISGDGFFAVDSGDGQISFTREGSFSPDANGDLRNPSGSRLLGFPLNESGAVIGGNDPGALRPVNIGQSGISVSATTNVEFEGNLDATSDPANPGVDFSRTVSVFDSTGAQQDLNLEFEASGVNQFDLTIRDSNGTSLGAQTLQFDSTGQLVSPANGEIQLNDIDFGNGSAPQDITLDVSGVTQFSGSFSVSNVTQNGFGPGNLSSVSIGEDGSVTALFSNGAESDIAQIPLASFASPNGLQPMSNNQFRQTQDSGEVNLNLPGQGGSGQIQPGTLEGSNVNLTLETVNLIQSDIAFRAAISAIKAQEEQFESLLDINS